MYLTVEPFPNGIYPGDETDERAYTPFRTDFVKSRRMLLEEVRRIQQTFDDDQVIVQVGYAPGDLKRDGSGPKANAKPYHPGLNVRFEREGVWVAMACDHFKARGYGKASWRENLHAIAKGLEYLRGLERYGVGGGGQAYQGFAELGTGALALGATSSMSVSEAATWLASWLDGWDGGDIEIERGVVGQAELHRAYRLASLKLHPDTGESPDDWAQLQEAHSILLGAVR